MFSESLSQESNGPSIIISDAYLQTRFTATSCAQADYGKYREDSNQSSYNVKTDEYKDLRKTILLIKK